jgi:alkylation response protein AidB-like acyl-CoA dehydrogenase
MTELLERPYTAEQFGRKQAEEPGRADVDLILSEDQEFFLETTRRFLAAQAPMPVIRSLEHEPAGYTPDYWRQACELGWTSMLVSEADGGGSLSSHGLLDLALVAEEMGRTVAPGPLVPVNLVAFALSAAGTTEQREAVLPGLLAGDATAAWTGPTPIPARHDADRFVVGGTASIVEAGGGADHLLVVVDDTDGTTHLLVPSDHPGVTITPLGSLDLVRRFARIEFIDVTVDQSAVVGRAGAASVEVARLDQIATVLGCAEAAGAADRCFGMTLDYLQDRYSFGRPLASYQALKHRLADDKLWLEACHATVTAALEAVATGADDAGALVSVAKAWVGPHATEIIQDCVQLHGGIGVTWEHDLHLYLRRATVNRLTHGTPDVHRERIAAMQLAAAS